MKYVESFLLDKINFNQKFFEPILEEKDLEKYHNDLTTGKNSRKFN